MVRLAKGSKGKFLRNENSQFLRLPTIRWNQFSRVPKTAVGEFSKIAKKTKFW